MFYLANDLRPDLPDRRCWTCGFADTPRNDTHCANPECGAEMEERRFLVSARWEAERFEAFTRYFRKQLRHPGLATPIDVFVIDGVLFSVIPYAGEGLMVDEASPLRNQRLLDLGQRIVGTLAYLNTKGVSVAFVNRANLLVTPDNTVKLFDLEVDRALENGAAIAVDDRGEALASVGELLRRYCDIEANDLIDFTQSVEAGRVLNVAEVGRAIERRYDDNVEVVYPPLLGGMSDVGLTRQLNEDNWGWIRLSDRAKLYVVADGMGGHDGGEVASALAVKTICEVALEREALAPEGEDAVENLLDESFQAANNMVKDTAEAKGTDMGTTLVCILVLDDRVGFMANVGDSRGYLLRSQKLHQITKDHSLVQKMVERGRITPEEARHHPHSNILLRTVGTEHNIDIDIFRVELEPGDRVLMCSDGLWGEVEDRDMESILNTYTDPRIASRELVRAAHHGGGKDNVTLMIVQIP
ncbi:MAG: Stp1/IreP family PP2C-type Ser/Thr phosphatase [Myxococcales bacterium]|nr:Stp1/IreP family PP2C-type Ser/Thr phosphatase [Myxococcales bacterium]